MPWKPAIYRRPYMACQFTMKPVILAYPVILTEYNDDGHYDVVTSPNIQGLVTDGNTIAEALVNAEDAIETMLDGSDHPKVQNPKQWQLKGNQQISWVTVNRTKWQNQHSKRVRRNISIPAYLSKWAKDNQINVSKVITEALKDMRKA